MQGVRPKVQDVRPKVPSPVKTETRIQPHVRYGNIVTAFPKKEKNRSALQIQPAIGLLN